MPTSYSFLLAGARTVTQKFLVIDLETKKQMTDG